MTDVTCAIILENNKILATRRSPGMPHALKWEFPGGKVHENETPESCIIREIGEELGVGVEPGERLADVIHHYETHSIRLMPFICSITNGTLSLSEHHEYRWVACDELDGLDWLEADVEVVQMLKARIC